MGLLPGGLSEAAAETAVRAGPSAVSGPGVDDTGSDGAGSSQTSPEDEALEQAKRTGEKVEVAALRGETRDVFATPDGQFEANEYLRPVRARVGGEWKPVDTDLAKDGDGMVAPKVATVDVAFSGGGKGPMVQLQRVGRELSLSWPTELPAPTLDGATATYPEVLPGVDLRLSAQVDGFSQLLVVKSAEAAANPELEKLQLRMAADGVQVQKTATGGLEAIDEGAKTAVFEASAPLMWDSSAAAPKAALDAAALKASGLRAVAPKAETRKAREAAEPGNATREPGAGESGKLAPIDVDVPASGERLVLTPDHEVLKGRDTVYPVYLDPQWHTPRATAWTMASKYWANAPQWKFNGKSDEGLGYCEWHYCNPQDTKRLFYRIPTSTYAGKTVLSAEFVVRNTWSASCSDREVQLWRTKDIDASTTWNSQDHSNFWLDKLATRSFAYGWDGCAAGDAEFDVKSAVQEAANKKWPTMTFGLRATSESDRYAWKRFSDKAHLRVKYNRAPRQIKTSQLLMEYGGRCVGPDDAPRVRSNGWLHANNVTDPDGDRVSVEFQAAWDSGDGKGTIPRWKPGRTNSKKSGSDFRAHLPATIPMNKTIAWYVRSYDGSQYSPWSSAGSPTSCYFSYDSSVPKAPGVSSDQYPASDPENPDDPWLDGVGQYGDFTLDSSSADVTRYRYGINQSPSAKNEITTSGGAAKVVKVLPAKPGLNFVTAQAFDKAGNASEIRTYQFRVKAGQPERAIWRFDEDPRATAAAGSAPPRATRLHGGAQLGVPGAMGTALKLDGTTGYASTDTPVVDTHGGFTVSAWVNLSEVPKDRGAVVAAQPGNHRPGFELYYSSAYQRWAFNQWASDDPQARIVRVMPAQPGGVKAGQWTHLVGTYDSVAQRLKLFVNGKQVGETAHTTAWNARRGLQIGATGYDGKPDLFFPGTIDELQIFDKGIAPEEVERLYAKQRVGDPGRPAVAVFGLDEQAGDATVNGYGDVLPARFHGGAKAGTPGISRKALWLDGVDDYARVGVPHLNTTRSFAVSLWAKLPKTKPDRAAVAIAQSGNQKAGFELYYSSAYDRWVLNQHSADTADATSVRVMQPDGAKAYANSWTHLVGVHDTIADTLTLYVNGTSAGSVKLGGSWGAAGPMFVGAGASAQTPGNFFQGQIDDVRLFARPVSSGEVRQLFKQSPEVKGRWRFEEASGTPLTSPDDLPKDGNPMKLVGSATVGRGRVEKGALQLDGVNDYAASDTVPVDTSGSYTVTAWAQAAATPRKSAALVSAEGSHHSGFVVRYVPDAGQATGRGRWRITLPNKDAADASLAHVDNDQFSSVTDWTHLALVYDGFAKEARLYVDGRLQEIACSDANGDGEADDSTCADRVPWAENVLTFQATKSLQIGRAKSAGAWGEYWPGSVDDVWTFQGSLSESQIARLAQARLGMPTEVPSD
ncbi:LamG-like jellyroll fold domain-containing protein [Streptomyces sp. SAJ15]|uniref:LamG-like jellyroll fold domain-containing protein n=1 Tax=Streptomyces sp. SAJ15 TaxID=2011095 RepID=UPI0021B21DD2|nr:LamG-like jellyroll fold domain-containing protein [Streptomyces sp. SAJ15]